MDNGLIFWDDLDHTQVTGKGRKVGNVEKAPVFVLEFIDVFF
jgi:hypothetical protein